MGGHKRSWAVVIGVSVQIAVSCYRPASTRAPSPDALAALGAYLDGEVTAGSFPGGVVLVGYRGQVVFTHTFGRYGVDDPRPVTDSTIYDLASLTKVVGLTTAVMLLVAQERLDIDDPVGDYVPEFRDSAKTGVRVRHLLLHNAGLPAWRPLYREAEDPRAARAMALTSPLESPPGARYVYSDIGAMALTSVVERVAGMRLDSLLQRDVFAPLEMQETRFLPPESQRHRIAPTEDDPWRGRVLVGEVHDENAARLGGVSGHAGLFSTAHDLSRFAFWLLDAYHGRAPAGPLLPAPVVRRFTQRLDEPPGSSRALGWDTPSDNSSAGDCLSRVSFGHTGFTGTSLWIDPGRELVVILLTNRVHPTRENNAIRRVRPAVANLAVAALFGRAACPEAARVDMLTGPS